MLSYPIFKSLKPKAGPWLGSCLAADPLKVSLTSTLKGAKPHLLFRLNKKAESLEILRFFGPKRKGVNLMTSHSGT